MFLLILIDANETSTKKKQKAEGEVSEGWL